MGTMTISNRREETKSWKDDGKHYANLKLRGTVFAGRDLANADFRGAELIECDFTGCNLSCAKFMGANCWGANFTHARLYKANFTQAILSRANFNAADVRGITVTLNCDTFENIQLPKKWMNALLFMVSLADIPVEVQDKLHHIIGEEELKIWQAMRLSL